MEPSSGGSKGSESLGKFENDTVLPSTLAPAKYKETPSGQVLWNDGLCMPVCFRLAIQKLRVIMSVLAQRPQSLHEYTNTMALKWLTSDLNQQDTYQYELWEVACETAANAPNFSKSQVEQLLQGFVQPLLAQ